MKFVFILFNFVLGFTVSATAQAGTVEKVRHLTRVKILESNTLSLRPGSIYDNITVFESIFKGLTPKFRYEFVDTGLGTAEPIYPMYQAGHQGSWLQLLPAFFSEKNRHIDHYTTLTTGAGCKVDGIYMLRHIREFPRTLYARERTEGYDLIVIRLEYFTRLHSNAECGRHISNMPDPDFNVKKFFKSVRKVKTFADFPADKIGRFEAKISAIRHIEERRRANDLPGFSDEELTDNSLWYYPQGHAEDYGLNEIVRLAQAPQIQQAKDLVYAADANLQNVASLDRVVQPADFDSILNFLIGKPVHDFDKEQEPGRDTLDIRDKTLKYFYTSGLEMIPIKDAYQDASHAENYRLVGLTIKPFEKRPDASTYHVVDLVPQVRLVYQLMNPLQPEQPLEQLYLHVNFDVYDTSLSLEEHEVAFQTFLNELGELATLRNSQDGAFSGRIATFMQKYTSHPVESVSFSSSVTGIWVFGQLTRNHDWQSELAPLRIVRNGIDLGYYSSSFDNDVFRAAIKAATGPRKTELQEHMNDLTVTHYRDPKRMDVSKIRFETVSCAQCHQLAGRDAVHMAFNDHIDPRITSVIRPSEFVFHESLWQLKSGQQSK